MLLLNAVQYNNYTHFYYNYDYSYGASLQRKNNDEKGPLNETVSNSKAIHHHSLVPLRYYCSRRYDTTRSQYQIYHIIIISRVRCCTR